MCVRIVHGKIQWLPCLFISLHFFNFTPLPHDHSDLSLPVLVLNGQMTSIGDRFHSAPQGFPPPTSVHSSSLDLVAIWACCPAARRIPHTFPVLHIFIWFYSFIFLQLFLQKLIKKACVEGKILDFLRIWKCLSSFLTRAQSIAW